MARAGEWPRYLESKSPFLNSFDVEGSSNWCLGRLLGLFILVEFVVEVRCPFLILLITDSVGFQVKSEVLVDVLGTAFGSISDSFLTFPYVIITQTDPPTVPLNQPSQALAHSCRPNRSHPHL